MRVAYTEDTLVQTTTAEYLEYNLGWESVHAYNQEDFGPDSLLGRSSDAEVVLTRILRQKLVELNPGLKEAVYDDAVKQITATAASQNLIKTNQEKLDLIRNGVQVRFRNDRGQIEQRHLRLLDFEQAENNHFLSVRELWVKGAIYRRRADIVGFINGLPLLFIECKNIHHNLKTAYENNYSDYLDTIPHLFHFNAIVMFGNGVEAKIGTVSSKWEHFHQWKRLAEEDEGVVEMETLLKGVCNQENLIDLIENFIVFDQSSGPLVKVLARNHQFLGVNRALKSVSERRERQGKLGVFWHTQGAGKSYSMLMLARKVRRKLGGNFTFLILTDRLDLDAQIYKTFAGCGVVDHDRDPCRATDHQDLKQLLSQQKSFIFSLIHKFNQEVDQPYTQREDIIVISDEAHRTQYGRLAANMRDALPNASYLGFTGTPLFSDDHITRRMFGDYVSTYDFQRAVEDRATVPLYYDARGDKLGIGTDDLNQRIADKLDELEIENIDVAERLERELKRDYHIITANQRLDQLATDLVDHYATSWETGKAMLICLDKITCVRMYDLIQQKWQQQIQQLQANLANIADQQEEIYLRRQLKWMEETQTAVVFSEEQGEVDKFRQWGLDVTFHRELIKKGIQLPESMRQREKFRHLQRMELDQAFKEPEHPFRIAIVCAMWLTGFDVPCLSNLYLDKPLKAHTLMQAIARANRVFEGKNNGLIVDYCGILKQLRQALATFAGTSGIGDDDEVDPTRPTEELIADLAESILMVRQFLDQNQASLDDIIQKTGFARNAAIMAAKEAANQNDESRKRFEILSREVFKKFKACLNVKEIRQYRPDRNAIDIVYKSLQQDREQVDISGIMRQLHQIVDDAVQTNTDMVKEPSAPYDISQIDFDRLRQEFKKVKSPNTTVQSLKQAVENKLGRLLAQNPLRTDFQLHYENLVTEYNRQKDQLTIERTFEALLKLVRDLDEEEGRAVREGLNQESLAIFDLLKKQELNPDEIKQIKTTSVELLEQVKSKISAIDQWQDKEPTRDAVKTVIYDFLYNDQTGLPIDSYSDREVEAKTEVLFGHILGKYPTVPSPYYLAEAS